jgi:phosphatidate cytidylyltransferase
MSILKGCHTALVTPFEGDAVDYEGLERLVNFQIASGIGGILAASATAVILAGFILPATSMVKVVPAAVVLAAIGICGDLAESIIKRATGVKDSGTLLGAHGGLLDRIDSLLLTAPLLYALLFFGVL